MRTGFIGLGNMGMGMASNLLEKGADLTVFTRTRSKIEAMQVKGAKAAHSTQELVKNVDIVMVCLPDVATSERVILEETISVVRPGQIVVDHSTVSVDLSLACYEALKAKQAFMLDAPISGGPVGAADGALSIMVGGDEDAFERVLPYFNMMGKNIKRMGGSGSGTAMKLVNQILVAIHSLAASEAFFLAESAGVKVQDAEEILRDSWGSSFLISRAAPIVSSREFANSKAPLRNVVKDIGIVSETLKKRGVTLKLFEESRKAFSKMQEDNKGDYDIAGVIEIVERLNP